MFEPSDINTSSTYRELKAVFSVLQSYATRLEGHKVGSSKPHLQKVAVDIFRLCFALGISLDLQWLPRKEKVRANLLSRFIDRDDWSLNPAVF